MTTPTGAPGGVTTRRTALLAGGVLVALLVSASTGGWLTHRRDLPAAVPVTAGAVDVPAHDLSLLADPATLPPRLWAPALVLVASGPLLLPTTLPLTTTLLAAPLPRWPAGVRTASAGVWRSPGRLGTGTPSGRSPPRQQ